MAVNNCIICPEGCGTVWIGANDATTITDWTRLVHVDAWRIVPNLQEASKKRTSDTGGKAAKFCSDVIDWTAEITNTLCDTDWLYADILTNPGNPSGGKTAWFFLGWGCNHAPKPHGTGAALGDLPLETTIAKFNLGTYAIDSGVYLLGIVNPPGFGIDNTGSDPATADWSINISSGPYLPIGAATGIYSVSDDDPATEAPAP